MRMLVLCAGLASGCYDGGGATADTTGAQTTTGTPTPGSSSSSGATDPGVTDGSSGPFTTGSTTAVDPTTGSVDPTTTTATGATDDTGPMCLAATAPCADVAQCCAGLECGTTSLGQVCCGLEGANCATDNGEDCCGDLLCLNGTTCGYNNGGGECEGPCTVPPALSIEKQRLATIGGSFLGICGDANHTYGYHVPAAKLPADDYSLEGAANVPVCEWHAAAIDIGMDWPVSRDWLKWLIPRIASDEIQGVAEVIGSYDGVNVRYWSDSAGWSVDGIPYTGEGHDTWTHVAIYRSTALEDHGILAGWTANGGP